MFSKIYEIEKSFKAQFPYGWFKARDVILGGRTTFINVGIVPINEVPNGILQNDPMFSTFSIDECNVIEHQNGCLSVDPEPGSYLAIGLVKTNLRKKKAKSEEDVVKTFDNYFKKVKKIVSENADKVYGRDRYSKNYFGV